MTYVRPAGQLRSSKMRNLPAIDGSGRKHKKMLLDTQVIPKDFMPNDLGNYVNKKKKDKQ
jgi:hypothetical protein